MRRFVVAVVLIFFKFADVHGNGDGDKAKSLEEVAGRAAEILERTVIDLNNQQQLTKEALKSESHKIETEGLINAKINSEEMKKVMDMIKRRDLKAEKAPALVYNELMIKLNDKIIKEAKQFLKSPIESSVHNYILKQEVAGTPIQHVEGKVSIEQIADNVVDRVKPVVMQLATSNQLSNAALSAKPHQTEIANAIEQKINSEELKKNMDRLKSRDPSAQTAPTLVWEKLLQNVKGQLGDDPTKAEAVLQSAIKESVKGYILKQETIIPPKKV